MSNVKVAVRVRPLNQKEKYKNAEVIIDVNGDSVAIANPKVQSITEIGDSREKVKNFTFDYCYDSTLAVTSPGYASQELVFQDLGTEVLQAAFEGYNACVFAYGQTSTGKTYTMMGYPGEVGLIPRICEGLFSHVDDCVDKSASFRVDISYLEIYNERVKDLLRPADAKPKNEKYTLKVREHPKNGPYVQDLSQHLVKDNNEIQMLLERGNDARTTAATYMHDHSSRSHAIVTVSFTQAKLEDDMPSEKVSKIHMVDLAGSERADPNFSPEYKGRLKEGANINKSLVTLGNVIKALAEKSILSWSSDNLGSAQNLTGDATSSPQGTSLRSKSFYVPYRDSVLTWLLKDSLGGNSKTLMISTITSASVYYKESLNTLRYSQRAKSIVNQPKVNEDANVSLIRELRREIEQLTGMLLSTQRQNEQLNENIYFVPTKRKGRDVDIQVGNFVSVQDTGTLIEEKLHENEAKANQLTKSWMEKWTETHEIMKDSDLCIRGLGNRASSMGVLIDSQLPHLIGMDDDILSTGVKMYHLKEGKTLVGTEEASRQQDIVLSGPLILKEHCFIKNHMGTVTLYPNRGAKCSLNGIDIREQKKLCQGDYILLGKVNMFRFNNPAEAAKLREHRKTDSSLPLQTCRPMGDQSCYSSSGSLADESSYAGLLPHFRNFNANLELEKTCEAEQEKIEQARKVLRSLSREHRVVEHNRVEREEKMWQQREQGSAEVDLEKQKLLKLIETTQEWKAVEDENIREAKKNLLERWVSYQKQLNGEIEKLKKQEHYAEQVKCLVTGADGEQICQHMMCVEGRYKALSLWELINIVKHNNMEMEVMKQEEQVEDHYQATRDKIKTQMQLIEKIKEHFVAANASRLDEVNAKVQELEDLQRKEDQLELYIEEKQNLIQVGSDKPTPLRSACSELVLTDLQEVGIPFKQFVNGISSQHHGSEGNLASVTSRLSIATGVDSRSSTSISSSRYSVDSLEQERESDVAANLYPSQKSGKKLSTTAQKVTNRLYQPTNAKFKYKPSKKNKKNDPRGRSPEKVKSGVVRSRSLETDENVDVSREIDVTLSPDCSGVMRGQMLLRSASAKLLQMSTLSLASVPEVVSESNEDTESSNQKNTFQVVRRRNKRHHFSDDDFRRHSEPVGETLASAFEQYSKEMTESVDSSFISKRSRKCSPITRGHSDEIDDFHLLGDIPVISVTGVTEDSHISSTSHDKDTVMADSSGGALVSSVGRSVTTLTGSISETDKRNDAVDMTESEIKDEPFVRSESKGDNEHFFNGGSTTEKKHRAKLGDEILLTLSEDLKSNVKIISQNKAAKDNQRGHKTSPMESSGNRSPSSDCVQNSEDFLLNTHTDDKIEQTESELSQPQLLDAELEQVVCSPVDIAAFTDSFQNRVSKEIPMAFQLLTSTVQPSVADSLSTEHEPICEYCGGSVDTDSLTGSDFAYDHQPVGKLVQSTNSHSLIISDNMIGSEHKKIDTFKDSQSKLGLNNTYQNNECTDFVYCSNPAQASMPLDAISSSFHVPDNSDVQPSRSSSLVFHSPDSDEEMLVIDYNPQLDVTSGSPTAETLGTQQDFGGHGKCYSNEYFSEDSLDNHERATKCNKLPASEELFVKRPSISVGMSPSESYQDNLEEMLVGEMLNTMQENSVQDLCVCVQIFPKVVELEVPSILDAAEEPIFQLASEKPVQSHNARRLARHKTMQKQRNGRDSEITSQYSDDSLASDGQTKSSSRPGSGSRRRRKPHSKGSEVSAKCLKSHSSEEYAPSESDDIYSDDSLTEFHDLVDKKDTPQLSEEFQKFNDCISDLSTVQGSDVFTSVSVGTSEVKMSDAACGADQERDAFLVGRNTNKSHETECQNTSIRTEDLNNIHTQIVTQTELSTSADGTQRDRTNRSLVVSPLSVWSSLDGNIRSAAPEFCHNVAGSVISTPDRPGHHCRLSPHQLSNGTTDVWTSEQYDSNVLSCLRLVDEDDSFVMESEVLSPTSAVPCDHTRMDRTLSRLSASGEVSEFYQNATGFCREEELKWPTDGPMVQSDSKIISADSNQTAVNINENIPVKFELTVQETETNVLFKFEKTEYRTYGLRSTENNSNATVPDSTDINLTETRHVQHDANFESTVREHVVFHLPGDIETESESNSIITNHFYQSTLNSEQEVDRENGQVSRESSVERQSIRESSDSYVTPTSGRQQNVNDLNIDEINFEESNIDLCAPAISEIGGLNIDINSDQMTHDPQKLMSAERIEQELSSPCKEVTANSSPRMGVKCGMEYPLKDDVCSNVESDCTSDYGTIASEGKQDNVSGESDSSQDVESLTNAGKFQSSDHNDSLLFPESPQIESHKQVDERQISPTVVINRESEILSTMAEKIVLKLDLENNVMEDHDQLDVCASKKVKNIDAARAGTDTTEGNTIDTTDGQNIDRLGEYEYIQMNGELVPLNKETDIKQSDFSGLRSTASSDSSRELWDQLRRGSVDFYMTPPELQRQSSESSDYRTPQQSPRFLGTDCSPKTIGDQVVSTSMSGGTSKSDGDQVVFESMSVEDVQIPDMTSNNMLTKLNTGIESRHLTENGICFDDSEGSSSELIENDQTTEQMEHYDGCMECPKPVYSESLPQRTISIVLNSSRTSLPSTRVYTGTTLHRNARQFPSETDDSIFSESFGGGLVRRSTRFQRHIRSLSDSAISSDFTDAESTTMSPGVSRTCDTEKNFLGSSFQQRIDVYGEHIATRALAYRVTEKSGQPRKILNYKTSAATLIRDQPNQHADVDLHSSEITIEKSSTDQYIEPNVLAPALQFANSQNTNHTPSTNFLLQSNSDALSSTILAIRRSRLIRSISLDSLATHPTFRRLRASYFQPYIFQSPGGNSEATDIEHRLLQIPVVSKANIVLKQQGSINTQTLSQDFIVDSEGDELLLENRPLSPGEVALGSQSLEEMYSMTDGYEQLYTNSIHGQTLAHSIKPGLMEKYPSLSELENDPECTDMDEAKSKSDGCIYKQDNRCSVGSSNDSITFIFMPCTHGANNTEDDHSQEDEERSLESTDEEPLPHRYGMNENYLPVYDRSVSNDNIPNERLQQKYHSRSKSLLDVNSVEDLDVNEVIFPFHPEEEFGSDQNKVFITSSGQCTQTYANGNISPDLGMEFVPEDLMIIRNEAIWQGSDEVLGPLSVSPELPDEYMGPADYLSPGDLKNQDVLYYPVLNIDGNQYVAIRPSDNFLCNSQREDSSDSETFVSHVVQATMAESGTQTDGESMTTDRSMLPRPLSPLFSPFRSHSREELYARGYSPHLNFSDEADNWSGLSALVLETTHLMRNINTKLPGMPHMPVQDGTLNGEDKVSYHWADEAAQTGRSLLGLSTAGIQTETGVQGDIPGHPGSSDDKSGNQERHGNPGNQERHAATTQTDERSLAQGEISITDYLPEIVETIAHDICIQRNASGVGVVKTRAISVESGKDSSWPDDGSVDSILQSPFGSGSYSVDLSSPQQQTSIPLTYKQEIMFVLSKPMLDDKLNETTENPSSLVLSSSTSQSDIDLETNQKFGRVQESSAEVELKLPEHDIIVTGDFLVPEVSPMSNLYMETDAFIRPSSMNTYVSEESAGSAQLSDRSEDNVGVTLRLETRGNMQTQYGKRQGDPSQVYPAGDVKTSTPVDQNTLIQNKQNTLLSALEQSRNTKSDINSAKLDNSFLSANAESDSTVKSVNHEEPRVLHELDDIFSNSCDESPKESSQAVPMSDVTHVDNRLNLNWSDEVSMSVSKLEVNLHGDKRSWTKELVVSESEVVSVCSNGKPRLSTSKEHDTLKLSISDREMLSIDEILVSNKNLALSEMQLQEFISPKRTKIDTCEISETYVHDVLPENGPKKENIATAETQVQDIVSEVTNSDTEGHADGIDTTDASILVDGSKVKSSGTDDALSEVRRGQDLQSDNITSGTKTDKCETTREILEKRDAESEPRFIENSSQLHEYLEDLGYDVIEAEEFFFAPEVNAEQLTIQPVKVKPLVLKKAEVVVKTFCDKPENDVMKDKAENDNNDSKKPTLSEAEIEKFEFIDKTVAIRGAIPAQDTRNPILVKAETEVHEYVGSIPIHTKPLFDYRVCDKKTKKPTLTEAEIEKHEFIDKSRNTIIRADVHSQTENTLLEQSKMASLSEAEIEKHEYVDKSVHERNTVKYRLSGIKTKRPILKVSETERHEFVDKAILKMEENTDKERTVMSLLLTQKNTTSETADTSIKTSPSNNVVEQDVSEFAEPGTVKERIIAFTEISKHSENPVEVNAQLIRAMNGYHSHQLQTQTNTDPLSDQPVISSVSNVSNCRSVLYRSDPISAMNRKVPVCSEAELQVQDYIPTVEKQNEVASFHDSVDQEHMLDDCTQTDGANINKLEHGNFDISALKELIDRGELTGSLKEELECLQKERLEIIELMSLNYLPASLTVELLEAKLNYCNGQTDLLLESLDEGLSDFEQNVPPHIMGDIIRDYVKHVDDEVIKSKQDFNNLKTKIGNFTSSTIAQHTKTSQTGCGRGRAKSRFRDKDLLSLKRRAEIESFQIERLMEQQRHDRSRSESPMKEHSFFADSFDEMTRGVSPVSARTSSPTPSVLSPHQHRNHLVALRCQVIKAEKQEETSQLALRHHSLPIHLNDSLSYSPYISVSVVDDNDHGMSTYTCKPQTSTPRFHIQPQSSIAASDGERMLEWPGRAALQSGAYRSLTISKQPPRSYPQDKVVMAQSVDTENESELLLDEIRLARQHNQHEISEALKSLKNTEEQVQGYKSHLEINSFSPEMLQSQFAQLRQAEMGSPANQSVNHSSFSGYVENILSDTVIQGFLTGSYELYD